MHFICANIALTTLNVSKATRLGVALLESVVCQAGRKLVNAGCKSPCWVKAEPKDREGSNCISAVFGPAITGAGQPLEKNEQNL